MLGLVRSGLRALTDTSDRPVIYVLPLPPYSQSIQHLLLTTASSTIPERHDNKPNMPSQAAIILRPPSAVVRFRIRTFNTP
jgi:hypothetical protein